MHITQEEINQYIDLDNKFKDRIKHICKALFDVNDSSIKKCLPDVVFKWSDRHLTKNDEFVRHDTTSRTVSLTYFDDDNDLQECYFDMDFLCITDEDIAKIQQFDQDEKEKQRREKAEYDKQHQQALQKMKEKQEYEEYLRLKKKYETDNKVHV